MHEFHPDDQYAIITEHLTEANVQDVSLITNPNGSYGLQLHVPIPGTDRFMEFTTTLEPFLAATLRTVAYGGCSQLDVELVLKGVCRRVDKDLYTVRITKWSSG